RVVLESGFIVWILTKILVYVQRKGFLYPFQRHVLRVHARHLVPQVGQVIAKTLQLAFCGQLKMSGNNMLHRQRKHVIESDDPVFHVAVIHGGTWKTGSSLSIT